MRILFVSHYALPHLGGIEVAIDAMARELSGRGHEVAYVASGAQPIHLCCYVERVGIQLDDRIYSTVRAVLVERGDSREIKPG